MKDSRLAKVMAMFGIALCGLCCTLPVVGVLFGIGASAVIGSYLEMVALTVILISALVFAYAYYKKRRAQRCDVP
jgi:hypothetical protein